MFKSVLSILLGAALLGSCGGSLAPTQRLADAQSAERSARELGANDNPQAQLSLKLAQQQISQAQSAIEGGDNDRANSLLIRAKADAELSVAQAREQNAKQGRQEAIADSAAQEKANAGQGAVK
ncbi:MAG TPA: DUF4398 domain-containing protein [Polyangiaceae bacterium]|jgi:hypothetical protein|nr:DUF4398 domain-containing protein [Polyangiaceae bacterium]